jgi:hypothetical protein
MTIRFKEGPGLTMVPDTDVMTPREYVWWHIHRIINRIAWRVRPYRAHSLAELRSISSSHIWRLNDWAADHWIPTWSRRNPE